MKKAIIINASPRKNFNTAEVLKSSERGAQYNMEAMWSGNELGLKNGLWALRNAFGARYLPV